MKISCFGHNFLNTFLLSFPFYTDANSVLDFLEKSLTEGIRLRERRRGSVTPQDAIRDARGTAIRKYFLTFFHCVALVGPV